MRILLLEDRPGVATEAEGELAAAGHTVARCHEGGEPGIACQGIRTGRACPLDEGAIDAAVIVRAEEHELPTPTEDGARCAVRRQVPVVLVGRHDRSPYLPWATTVLNGDGTLVAAVEDAARGPIAGLTRAADTMLREVLDAHAVAADAATAEVVRVNGDLRVVLRPGPGVSDKVAEVAAVRCAGAVRAADPASRTVDVTVVR